MSGCQPRETARHWKGRGDDGMAPCERGVTRSHKTVRAHTTPESGVFLTPWLVVHQFIKDWRMENLNCLLSDLQPNTEHLFVKFTLGFKRDFNRLGLYEPMTLAIEQHFLNMTSLCLHDFLYGLCLLWRHYLVLCSLQELYSCQ